jgi:deoxyribonuclease-4
MIRFGPSGNSNIFYDDGCKSSLEAPEWLKNHDLNAYEYSFGRMFNMSHESAKKLGEEAEKNGVLVSVHAPYYINLANPSDEVFEKNIGYLLTSLSYLVDFKGNQCVFHPGSCGKETRDVAVSRMMSRMDKLLERVYVAGYGNLNICPETMGKSMQLGSVKEVVELCKFDKCLIPTLDFGHINAVTGGTLKTADDYRKILDYVYNELGEYKAKNLHIHFSKIEYTSKGEVKHLTLDDNIYGPEFEPLALVIKEMGLEPTIISESKGMMMEDAIKLKSIYENIGGIKNANR